MCGFFAGIVFGCALLAMAFKLIGKKSFASTIEFLRRTPGPAKVVLLAGLLIFGHVGSTKQAGTNGFGMCAFLTRMLCEEVAEISVSADEGIADYFPSATNAVTNLTCVGMVNNVTSVVFGVRWPSWIGSSATGIDLYALDDLTRSNETNVWRWLGRAPVAIGESELLIKLSEEKALGAFGSQMFFTFGFAFDSDNDGLSDAFERIVSRTDPTNADTDRDGMPDGWEYENGLDPFSNDASDDADGDGICNMDELGLGTCPTARDTDGDGLDDLIESGSTNEVFMTEGLLTGGVVLTNLTTSAAFTSAGSVDCVDFAFPEPIELGGSTYERMSLDPNGIVYLRPAGSTDTIPSCAFPDDYGKVLSRVQDYVLMPYWSRLNVQAYGLNASEVTVKLIDGCYVVTYKNMRFDPAGMEDLVDPSLQALIPLAVSLTPVSFQTIIDPANSTVEYRYQISGIAVGGLDSRNYAKGRLASIGARGLYGATMDDCGFGKSDAIESGMGIKLMSSSGTNPSDPDTDGDGMSDGDETKVGRNPNDPADGNAPKNGTVRLCFGDPSNTHSESYRVKISAVDGSGEGTKPADKEYVSEIGQMFDENITLDKGWKYEVRMFWEATNLDDPDYDYVIGFGSSNPWVVIDDPNSLRECHVYEMLTTDFPASGKVATICVCDIKVHGIKFNYDSASQSDDAVNLMKNENDHIVVLDDDGEWMASGRNDPACYAGGAVGKIKAKFKVLPKVGVDSATLSSVALNKNFVFGGINETSVSFTDGFSDWTEMTAAQSPVMSIVSDRSTIWEWNAKNINGSGSSSYVTDKTGPHRVFTLLDDQTLPWDQDAQGHKCPWVTALEFVCGFADGTNTVHGLMTAITQHLFYNMGFRYDTYRGETAYTVPWKKWFDLPLYIVGSKKTVNCYDQAYGVATLGNLFGADADVRGVRPFGYINPTHLVGFSDLCNNPACQDPIHTNMLCDIDDALRSSFERHLFVITLDKVFDACCGPALGTQSVMEYLDCVIDISTTFEYESSYQYAAARDIVTGQNNAINKNLGRYYDVIEKKER